MNGRIAKWIFLFCVLSGIFFSCSGSKLLREAPPRQTPFSPAVSETIPVLRILDYKNRNEGAPLAPWFRSYLGNGIAGVESLEAYKNTYVFVARIHSARRLVVTQWFENFSPERDFSRLIAERIRTRLDRGLTIDPNEVYGPVYQSLVKAAYRTSFWGGQRDDDSWVRGLQTVRNEGGAFENGTFGEAEAPQYWGFVLVSIPKDTLEIQISALLQSTKGIGGASREQIAAFDQVKERFFDQF